MYKPDRTNFDREHVTDLTGTIVEPISLATMKDHLNVDFDADDLLIAEYMRAVREWIERKTNHLMTYRTFRADLPRFYDEIFMPWRPLIEVQAIRYYSNDSPTVLTDLFDQVSSPAVSSAVFREDTGRSRIYRARGESWPAVDAGRHDAVQITFAAGYALTGSPEQPTGVPGALKSALMLMTGDLYENRESTTQLRMEQLPTADRLLSLWREYA